MKPKIGTTVRGHVILKIGYQRFLVSSKTKALAVLDALLGAPQVRWTGVDRYAIEPGNAEITIEAAGSFKFSQAEPDPIEPPAPKPAPKPEPPKPAPPKPAPTRPEPEAQMVHPRPVSKRTARAQLTLIARSIDPEPAPERLRLTNGNVIALPDRARGPQQEDLFRLEAGGR